MNKTIAVSLFVLLFLWRWMGIRSPLTEQWKPGDKVRYTVTILEKPEYRDSQTIVRSEIWYIPIKGYTEIIPGSLVEFEGVAEPKIVLGKVTQIKMTDPTILVHTGRVGTLGKFVILLGEWREKWVTILQRTLPEPMAGLAAGILLGVKGQMSEDFYQALVKTGTLHIVAASGYNVSIVASVLMKMIGTFVSRGVGIGIGVGGIILYILISGSSASVVRAGIMGSLTLIAYYFGRPAEARRLLWVTAAIMLLHNPLMIIDVGFQLSFVATWGLLYMPFNNQAPNSNQQTKKEQIQNQKLLNIVKDYLAEYLYPTLAATIATLPVILWHFGRVSWISPIVNILVLPLVPLIMGMTAGVISIGMILPVLGQVLAWVTYVPLAWMVWVIRLFGVI